MLGLFKKGRWRAEISNHIGDEGTARRYRLNIAFPPATASKPAIDEPYSFAFQPIVSVADGSIFSYEALVRGKNEESAIDVNNGIPSSGIRRIESIHPNFSQTFLNWTFAWFGMSKKRDPSKRSYEAFVAPVLIWA